MYALSIIAISLLFVFGGFCLVGALKLDELQDRLILFGCVIVVTPAIIVLSQYL